MAIERRHIEIILTVGPLELYDDGDRDYWAVDHAKPHTDEVLREHWDAWAVALDWQPDAYAYWRFGQGLESAAALAEAQKEQARRHEWVAGRLRQVGSIGLDDPFLMHYAPAERREMLERAGL